MGKTRTWALWTAIGLGVLAYAGAGSAKLLGTAQMAEGFAHFGLPLWLMTFVGACEVAGAVGLLIRPLSSWAALGLAVIMVGAVVLHLRYDGIGPALPAAVLLVLMGYVAWQRRSDALFLAKPVAA
jgi:putative oxidoreductase